MRILIVDDEYWIREDLKKVIEELYPDRRNYVIAEASTGKEMLEKARYFHPDLIIVDVQMPVMDGLTAIEKMRGLYDDISYIILTGHSDFQYAMTAMHFGINEYVLKPVNSEEVEQAINNIEKDRNETRNDFRMSVAVNFHDELLGIHHYSYYPQFTRYLFQAVILFFDGEDAEITKKNFQQEFIRKETNDQKEGNCFITVEKGIVLIHYLKREYEREQEGSFLRRLEYEINKYIGIRSNIVCIASDELDSLTDTANQIKMCMKYGSFRITSRNGKVNKFQEVDAYISKLNTEVCNYVENLNEIMIAYHRKSIIYFIERCSNAITKWKDYKKHFDEELCNALASFFFCSLKLDNFIDREQADAMSFMDILNYAVQNVQKVLYSEGQQKESVTEKAVKIILSSYNEDISISSVAEKIGVSPNYLSALFHKEMGISFVKYVTKVRLDKAKELLKYKDYNINKVAYVVGYRNPNYFAKVFRDYAGISPSEYQQKYVKEKRE